MRPLLQTGTAALALLAASPALAAESHSTLDEIVVTATRRATALRNVPASVSTVGRADFEMRGDRFIGQELGGLAGVTVATNDAGTYTSLSIRGVPNRIHNDTLVVMMDGVPFVTGDDEVDLEQLPFGAVERVDVVRGPMSALYGRGAIAGTVNYLTREVGDELAAHVETGIGSFGWRQAGALLQAPTMAGGALLLTGALQRGEGWRDRTEREEASLFAKHRLDISNWGRLILTGSYVNTDQGLAGELPVNQEGEPIPLPGGRTANWNQDEAGFDKRMATGTALLEAGLADGLTATTRLHARQGKTRAIQGFFNRFDPLGDSVTFTGFRVDGNTDTLFADQQIDWTAGPWRLLGGVSAEQVEAHHIETWTGEFDFDTRYYAQRRDIASGRHLDRAEWRSDRLLDAQSRARNLAAYAQGDLELGAVTLSAGARWDRFSRRVFYGPSGDGFGEMPPETVKDTDQHISPKASAAWRISGDVTVYAAYGAGFSPGFGPLWSFRSRDTGLDPELADNIEAGIKGAFLDGRIDTSLTVYQLRRRDLLQLLPVEGTARTINTGRQRSRGLELETHADLSALAPGLQAELSYGFTDSVWTENAFLEPFTERPFDFSGKDVAGVPRHAGRAGLSWQWADLGFTARTWADFSGDYAYDEANSVRAGGHALWNAALNWVPPKAANLELTLTVRNLLDREVNSVVDDNDGPLAAFPQPPREVLLTARLRF